jgi:hypothetical protein
MGRSRYRFGEGVSPYFVTCNVVAWLPVFTRPDDPGIGGDAERPRRHSHAERGNEVRRTLDQQAGSMSSGNAQHQDLRFGLV